MHLFNSTVIFAILFSVCFLITLPSNVPFHCRSTLSWRFNGNPKISFLNTDSQFRPHQCVYVYFKCIILHLHWISSAILLSSHPCFPITMGDTFKALHRQLGNASSWIIRWHLQIWQFQCSGFIPESRRIISKLNNTFPRTGIWETQWLCTFTVKITLHSASWYEFTVHSKSSALVPWFLSVHRSHWWGT